MRVAPVTRPHYSYRRHQGARECRRRLWQAVRGQHSPEHFYSEEDRWGATMAPAGKLPLIGETDGTRDNAG